MYKVVTKNNHNEVWAVGFYSKEKAERLIKDGYFTAICTKLIKAKNWK